MLAHHSGYPCPVQCHSLVCPQCEHVSLAAHLRPTVQIRGKDSRELHARNDSEIWSMLVLVADLQRQLQVQA